MHLVGFISLLHYTPDASSSILYVSEIFLSHLKQNLMQIRCSFTSVILTGRHDRKTALTRHKNAHKNHTRPHSKTPLGRVIQKGYSSRYVAAHNCTTSGFRAAFLFWGLLRSTSCYIRVKEERNILHTMKVRKANWTGHILRTNCFWNTPLQVRWKDRSDGTTRKKHKQLLDGLEEKRGYFKLKE